MSDIKSFLVSFLNLLAKQAKMRQHRNKIVDRSRTAIILLLCKSFDSPVVEALLTPTDVGAGDGAEGEIVGAVGTKVGNRVGSGVCEGCADG
jgi:hypothetical protein